MLMFRVPFTTEERDSLVRILMQAERICSSSRELLELATVIGFLAQKHGLPMHAPKTWRQVIAQLERIIFTGQPEWQEAVQLKNIIQDTAERELAASRRF